MKAVVLGFYSLNGEMCKDLLNFPPGDSRLNFITVDTVAAIFEHLITNFTTVGSVILDMTGQKGVYDIQ